MCELDLEVHILAVDDESTWRTIVGHELGKAGLQHSVVSSADEAIENIETGGFTGVVTDGLEGKWRQVAEAASAASIPVAVFSGEKAQVDAATEAGVQGFVKKMPSREGLFSDIFGAVIVPIES